MRIRTNSAFRTPCASLALLAVVLGGCEALGRDRTAPSVVATPLASAPMKLDAGPMLGAVTQTGARVWVHVADIAKQPGGRAPLKLFVEDPDATEPRGFEAEATVDSGGCATLRIEGLRPGVNLAYRIVAGDGTELARGRVRTQVGRAPQARLAFGSCADIDDATRRTWEAIGDEHPDALVLLGDTPYVDSTGLATQREKYLAFAQVPTFAALVAKTPLYSVWDDHDFGANNTDGRLAGKSNSRRAFMENRPNPTCGEGAAGIYTSFRQGEVEVFLLDTRWFAGTEPSKQDPAKPTLLGEPQWRWLENGLAKSKAAFKVIACGMVWNGLVEPGKSDCWGAYPHEYERFVRLLASTKATGVVLVSGDVHRSRVLRHATAKTLGYDLTEFVTSPLHGRIIKEADVRGGGEHGGEMGACTVVFDRGEPNAFLLLDADTPSQAPQQAAIVASFVNAKGERFGTERLLLSSLCRKP